jgi:hypothetical protein
MRDTRGENLRYLTIVKRILSRDFRPLEDGETDAASLNRAVSFLVIYSELFIKEQSSGSEQIITTLKLFAGLRPSPNSRPRGARPALAQSDIHDEMIPACKLVHASLLSIIQWQKLP